MYLNAYSKHNKQTTFSGQNILAGGVICKMDPFEVENLQNIKTTNIASLSIDS